jgi:hypothetical protein
MTIRMRRLSLVWAPALVAAGLFVGAGCDTDSASSEVDVSPSSVVLEKGKSATFTASGGYEYTWSLDPNDGSGRLNTTKGAQVTYTCLSTDIGSSPKRIVVTSTIEGTATGSSSSSTSNTTSTTAYQVQGHAEVFYPDGGTGVSALTISPSSATIGTNASRTFTVTGGTSPYQWVVSSPSLGSCSPTTGNSTTYTASGTGVNTLTCLDNASQRDEVTITQNP